MNKNQLATLKKEYKGQREFSAKTEGYSFDVFSDEWVLGYKEILYMAWMYELNTESFMDLRLTVAYAAKHYPHRSINTYISTLRKVVNFLDIYAFEAWWLTLDTYKNSVRHALGAFCRRSGDYRCITLTPLYETIKDEKLGRYGRVKGIFDVETGAYSEVEHDNLLEAIRIETLQVLNYDLLTQKSFTHIRTLIATQLMVAIIRRPTQLVQIKWCDLLPVGHEFKSHKKSDQDRLPETQHLFSDVEQFHLRTFKGKDGQFRGDVESRTHRLSPDCSELFLKYYNIYLTYLRQSLNRQGITLTDEEEKRLMRRLPLLPDQSLFVLSFQSKLKLFKTVSHTSKAYHQTPQALTNNITYLFRKKLDVKSDRLPNKPLIFANNRWRHTQLTLAAWMGLSPAQIAAMTGVTIDAIIPYLDLKAQERVKINQAYAGNSIILRFDTTSVEELQKHSNFCVKSPLDEEMGYKLNPSNCSSCESKGGAPMACYPCNNFRPLENANHKQYLDKAERKLTINSQSAHPSTLKRLQTIIVYIKATIAICEDKNTLKFGNDK